MNPNPLQQLSGLGQSVWLDYIHRELFTGGRMRQLIEQDALTGMTSNPAIFEKAIDHGHTYDEQIHALAAQGCTAAQIYEAISRQDVQLAADALRGSYDRSDGVDGYVSLEVNPHLARDTRGTVEEGRRLWAAVGRPNLYIKVPGTEQGLPAISQLLAEGINVNVTLLFSLPRYRDVIDAYLTGLERRQADSAPLGRVSSVASFFISRIDTLVDTLLEAHAAATGGQALPSGTVGQVAVACARLAYQMHRQVFAQERFRRLAAHGARPQRLLWASTSTKNPRYSDVKYVEALIGPDTIDTMPMETLDAYRDHGQPQLRLTEGLEQARAIIQRLPGLGIELDEVSSRLEQEGVDKFERPYDILLQRIAAKSKRPGSRPGRGAPRPEL